MSNFITNKIETFQGEGLKSAAEFTLAHMSRSAIGATALELYAHGMPGRIENPVLVTDLAGIEFDNPVLFGAGWDKKGRAVNGLYELGFAGGEVGTVLPFGQYGNDKPRLWTINPEHSVGLNRLGFNSLGMTAVKDYLDALNGVRCPIGINVGRNKISPNEHAPWAHATVIDYLYDYGDFFVLGVSSPNTPDLRGLQDKGPLRDNIQASHGTMDVHGIRKPLWIKIDAERSEAELDDMIEVGLEEGIAGFVATNTYMGSDIKAKYGKRWATEAGGLSGDDPDYREASNRTIRYIYEQAGDRLQVIGVGGVKDTQTAIEKLQNGASAVEVVTAIRPSYGRVAAQINRGLVSLALNEGLSNVRELVGTTTKRGQIAA